MNHLVDLLVRRFFRRHSPRRAVYTSVYGNYDTLKPHPPAAGVDFICFTDNADLQSEYWQIRHDLPRYAHPRMSAKYHKMLPHQVLSDYDETLWIDGSVAIKSGAFINEAFSYLARCDIALFKHPDRKCIYAEAEISRKMRKYRDQAIEQQVSMYRSAGYPADAGLFACGVMARNNHSLRIRKLNEAWLEQNEKYTYQDQLSFPVLLRELNIKPAIFRHNYWRNPWFDWIGHAHRY